MTESSSRSRVLLVGEWETSNLGDRAILSGASAWLGAASLEAVPIFFGALRPAAGDAERATVPAARARRWRQWLRPDSTVVRMARDLRGHHNAERLMPLAAQTDAIVVGGGALLDGRNGHFIPSLTAFARVAERTEIPMVSLGCGRTSREPPEGREARSLRRFLRACRFVAVRDRTTSELLSPLAGYELSVFGDFAFTGHSGPAVRSESAMLGVNVMQVPPGIRGQYETALVKSLESAQGFSGTLIFTTGEAHDAVAAKRVADAARLTSAPLVVFPRTETELRMVIGRCGVVVASRLHAAVIGLDEGARIIDANPDQKIATYVASLVEEPVVQLDIARVAPITATTGSRPDADKVAAMEQVRSRARDLLWALIRKLPENDARAAAHRTG